jgi:RNA polymerase sigma-54 factor
MQTFDPPGVCARDLRECLLLQIKRMNPSRSLTGDIIAGISKTRRKRIFAGFQRP